MQKYYDKLDDYTDADSTKINQVLKRIMPTVIFIGSIALMFIVCGALEVM